MNFMKKVCGFLKGKAFILGAATVVRANECADMKCCRNRTKRLQQYLIVIMYIHIRLLSRYNDWLRAGRSGIESRWRRVFPPLQTGPAAHPASCKMGTGSFPRVKCGRGVLLTTHHLLVSRLWKSRAIPLPTVWATPGLQWDHFYIHIQLASRPEPIPICLHESCRALQQKLR